ncbi:MAG TPA: hypothetical protein VHE79_15730 [Spirochaetia bacterium]
MSKLLAVFLIVGIPLILSLAWFFYWVVRIVHAAKKKKRPHAGDADEGPGDPAQPPSHSSRSRRSPEI